MMASDIPSSEVGFPQEELYRPLPLRRGNRISFSRFSDDLSGISVVWFATSIVRRRGAGR